MEKALLDFTGRLRRSGVPVSPAEVLDAGRVFTALGLADRTVFKDGLRSVLVKRGRDIPIFDSLFDLCFAGSPIRGRTDDEPSFETEGNLARHLQELVVTYQPELSLPGELIMTGQFAALARLIQNSSLGLGLDRMESPLQVNYYLRRFRQQLDLDGVRNQSGHFIDDLAARGLDLDRAQAMRQYLDRNLERLDEELKRLLREELARNRYLYLRRLENEDLAERRLSGLSEVDIMAMRPAVERLARRIKDRLSRRYRHAEAGRFDLKATLRANIGLGGPLPWLRFHSKKPHRPQVVALCDVSNSVRNFSRFMLLFLYTLKEVVARVRSFIFVGDLIEVTELFRRREINEAVALAAAGHGLQYAFRTDYGAGFLQFQQDHLACINSRTTVFILGDARSNFFDPNPAALESIAKKARRLVWLNPEPRNNWKLGDSVMETYRRYCTKVVECGNLKQLSEIIEYHLLP
jgi:hypothetical protein